MQPCGTCLWVHTSACARPPGLHLCPHVCVSVYGHLFAHTGLTPTHVLFFSPSTYLSIYPPPSFQPVCLLVSRPFTPFLSPHISVSSFLPSLAPLSTSPLSLIFYLKMTKATGKDPDVRTNDRLFWQYN